MKNFAKILAVLLTLCMLMGTFMIPTVAADEQSAEKIAPDTSWYTGAENEEIVYEIYDAADLLGFATLGNSGVTFKRTTVKLMADIDLNPGWDATTVVSGKNVTLKDAPANVWDSIPTFEGILDGNGKTISGIYSYNTPEVPGSAKGAGGFIDKVAGGEIKDLIVLNSLAVIAPTTGYGSLNLNAGGFIGQAEDATLTTLYVDMDAWLKFDYHLNFGGFISSIGTSGSAYTGKVEDIVFAGTVGAISTTSNDYTTSGKRSTSMRFGGVIAASQNWMGTKEIKLNIKNLAFTGTLYWPGGVSGDPDICNTGSGNYNVGIGIDNLGEYYNYVRDDRSITPVVDLDATAPNNFSNKNSAGNGNAEDTYADAGWVKVAYANGYGLEEILLPGAVYEMISASNFVVNKTAENVAIDVDSSWYTGKENKEIVYYLYDAADLLGFAELGNDGVTFKGATIKVMADIDLNPGWDASTKISGTTATLAAAPANPWLEIAHFKGVFNGQGHIIRGVYAYREFRGDAIKGGFIDQLSGGTLENVIFLNCLTYGKAVNYSSANQILGGLVGGIGAGEIKTIYADVDTWWIHDAYKGSVAGFLGVIMEGYENNAIDEIGFAGYYGIMKANGDITDKKDSNGSYVSLILKNNAGTVRLGDMSFITTRVRGYYNNSDLVWNASYCAGATMEVIYYDNDSDCVESNMLNTPCDYMNNPKWATGASYTYAERGWKEVSTTGADNFVAKSGHYDGIQYLPGTVADMVTANTSNLYLQKSNDGTKIRFIGVVNLSEEELENFSMLGFDITMTYNGAEYTNHYTTSTIYTSLVADGETVAASEYGGTYFYAIEITGLDAATSEVVFDIDGITIHSGEDTTNVFGSATTKYTPAS